MNHHSETSSTNVNISSETLLKKIKQVVLEKDEFGLRDKLMLKAPILGFGHLGFLNEKKTTFR